MMTNEEKIILYDLNRLCIHPVVKSDLRTKPLWRKLFWTTARDSREYKIGCIEILETYFPQLFQELIRQSKER